MRKIQLVLAGIMLLSGGLVEAASKDFKIKSRITKIVDGVKKYENTWYHHDFRVDVLSDIGGYKKEYGEGDETYLLVREGERYYLRLHNPLPVRVAVNLTVDGLNAITGNPAGLADGTKWVIPPLSYITVRGWQVDESSARRFFFTDKARSYAKWRGKTLGKNFSVNCGVLGAAFFWNKKELQDYYDNNPTIVHSRPSPITDESRRPDCKITPYRPKKPQGGIARSKEAGTGMGKKEANPIHWVDFKYDAGMYKLSQAIVIRYQFGEPIQANPFPGNDFSPEMTR